VNHRSLHSGAARALPAIVAGLLAACSSTQLRTTGDYCAATPAPGMARVVLNRPSGFVGGGARMPVFDDGQPIGEVGNGGRLCWDRHPGLAYVTAAAPAGVASNFGGGTGMAVQASIRAGETLVIEAPLADVWRVSSQGR
jgi:hypothetical protein